MAWPRLRKRRSSTRLITVSNRGEPQTPSPASEGPRSGGSVRLIWPGTNGEGTAGAAEGAAEAATAAGPGSGPGQAAGPGADQDDLPFWDWSPDQSEFDDPSDAFAPDRPEDPDGPDYPDYRVSGSTGAARVTPAPAGTGGFGGGRASWVSRESRDSQESREPREPRDKGLRRPREAAVTTAAAQADEPRREGIGQHLGNLAHLSADPRMRSWQWRAVIAIVVMVAFSIVAGWRVGLALAVLAVIADTIIRSRRVMLGPAGVRQNAARRRTRRQLRKLERAGYRAEHNVLIPGSEDQIDHLVIGPAGVFAIDSEGWDRRLPVRATRGTQLWHGPFSMKDRLEHARWESERAAARLSSALGTQVTVRPAMAVYGPKLPWDVSTIRDVDVFSGRRLRRYLRRVARKGDTRLLSDSEIERIDKAAQTAFTQAPAR
jgi:Nuclease-related domain